VCFTDEQAAILNAVGRVRPIAASPTEHDAFLEFVERLSEELELPADITPENSETAPFMTHSPTTHSWTIHLRLGMAGAYRP
jgi:hypothetical protein